MNKSQPAASISFPTEDKEERMKQWDKLMEGLGTTRSGMVASLLKTGKIVDPKQMLELAHIASKTTANRQYVVFWVPKP